MQLLQSCLAGLILLMGLVGPVLAQEGKLYTDPIDRFQLQLEPDWEEISYTDNSGQRRLSFVFRGSSDKGELKIRKLSLDGLPLEAFIEREEGTTLQYLPGFVRVKRQELFGGGQLKGKFIEFNFKRNRQDRLARYYYLVDDKNNLWILLFSGRPDYIRSLRPNTDQMARSFKLLEQ